MVLHELFGLVYKSLKGHLSIFCVNPALGDSSLYPERNFQTFINSPSHTASWNIISETSFDLVVSIENRFRFSVKKYYNFFTTIQHFKIHDFKVNFWNLIFLTFMPMYCVKFQSTLLDFFTFDIWLVVLGSIIPVLLPLPGLYNFFYCNSYWFFSMVYPGMSYFSCISVSFWSATRFYFRVPIFYGVSAFSLAQQTFFSLKALRCLF